MIIEELRPATFSRHRPTLGKRPTRKVRHKKDCLIGRLVPYPDQKGLDFQRERNNFEASGFPRSERRSYPISDPNPRTKIRGATD
jgi:hypothetical protein